MKSGKYVIFEDDTAIVFPDYQVHATMARLKGGNKGVKSAGFFWNDGGLRCYGESISIGVRSHDGDEKIIEKYL